MKYIKLFEEHAGYEAYKNSQDYLTPNVSYCVDRNEVHFEKYVRDYSKEYFTIEALEDTVLSIVFDGGKGCFITRQMRESFSYSVDEGETWTTFETPNDTYAGVALETPTIHAGEKVLWKGIGNINFVDGFPAICHFTSTGNYSVYGNIMSLSYGDEFIGQVSLVNENVAHDFRFLFTNNTTLASAEKLVLPATTLADNCYGSMFNGCTSLTTAPELPATTLAEYCYSSMFNGCQSLTTAPELLTTTLANNCYSYMFHGCTSLTTAPELPATTLANNCYSYMFYGCTSLTTAPELPATTLAEYCYSGMFNGCTSLTTASELTATTLAEYCYLSMFNGCTSLTTAPELPATRLVYDCYSYMFYGCTNLNYIKAMCITAPSLTYTNDWVSGVSSTGTFVKNSAAIWNVSGTLGIPSGWTVQTASA